MKKKALLIALTMGMNFTYGQTTVNFESLSLSPESFDNGSGGAANHVIGDLTFSNYYDATYDYWVGFAFSNTTDVTTFNYSNQYSSVTGSGVGGSSVYAVFYPDGNIQNNGTSAILGFDITNTALAKLSMENGDGFAKQFGSPNNASGNPDGTNGEDYFRVWIIGTDETGNNKDSILFYLADYRFSDNSQDYIVTSWEHIDLTGFAFDVKTVSFRFESSDMSMGYINTPTYLALDNVLLSAPLGVDVLAENIRIYPNPIVDYIAIEGLEDGDYRLLEHNGKVISSGTFSELKSFSFAQLLSGSYLLELKSGSSTVVKHIVH